MGPIFLPWLMVRSKSEVDSADVKSVIEQWDGNLFLTTRDGISDTIFLLSK